MVIQDFILGFVAGFGVLALAFLLICIYVATDKENRMRRKHQGCCNCKFHTPAGHCKCSTYWNPFTNVSITHPSSLIYGTKECHYEPKE